MKHVRPNVRAPTAEALEGLKVTTGLSHAKVIRHLLLGEPLIPASHLRLWQKLARTKANLTQIEQLVEGASEEVLAQEILVEVRHAQHELNQLRRCLLGIDMEVAL